MPSVFKVALVGDYSAEVVAHRAADRCFELLANRGIPLVAEWVHTTALVDAPAKLKPFAGVWCVPASPYANTQGALDAIRFARESNRPFLGTCGGFQHAVLEYAMNVLQLADVAHAELDPEAAQPIIAKLACSLVEEIGEIDVVEGTRIAAAYAIRRITEGYHCSYGFNPSFQESVLSGDMFPTAFDLAGDVRAVEIASHPFFVATLFQHERRALNGEVPPLVLAFAKAILER